VLPTLSAWILALLQSTTPEPYSRSDEFRTVFEMGGVSFQTICPPADSPSGMSEFP